MRRAARSAWLLAILGLALPAASAGAEGPIPARLQGPFERLGIQWPLTGRAIGARPWTEEAGRTAIEALLGEPR
jgi:hypothetical protein